MDAKLLLDPKMTWFELICLALMLLLAVSILGPPKTRRFALALLQRCVQGIGLAALLACAVFLVWPAAVPNWLNSGLSPVAEYLVRLLGESFRSVVWLVLAAAVTLIAAPLAIQLGFARKLDSLAALVRRAGGTSRAVGRSVPQAAPAQGDVRVARDELAEAVGGMGATASRRPKQAGRVKVADLFRQQS